MQAEIMSLRSGQWLQVIREQAQSGQTAPNKGNRHRGTGKGRGRTSGDGAKGGAKCKDYIMNAML